VALGEQRTRAELVPFLNDSVDDEDEVLLVLATQLGEFAALVGGPEHTYHLLAPLESLATMEDPPVRNTAVASLCSLGASMPAAHHQEHFVPLLRRLATNDWFTSRIAAAALFTTAYPKVDAASRAEYVGLFSALCRDDTPMVRRAAAQALAEFTGVVETGVVREHLVPLFVGLAGDAQDSVKLLAVSNCIAIAEMLSESPEEKIQAVLPVVLRLASDNSYRVRWSVASHMGKLGQVFGPDITQSQLLPCLQKLLQDPEPETRSIAAGSAEAFAALLPVETIVQDILPVIRGLVEDDEAHVRVSLAGSIMGMSPKLGRDLTIEHLLPMFLKLLKDTDSDVRLKVISKLSGINQVVGVTLLSQSLLPAIVELAEDSKWRVRLAIIEHIPLLASQLGVDFFNEKLVSLLPSLLPSLPIFARHLWHPTKHAPPTTHHPPSPLHFFYCAVWELPTLYLFFIKIILTTRPVLPCNQHTVGSLHDMARR
jgi:serine/threonine-protein phosphatase 2A regulatory subunit A